MTQIEPSTIVYLLVIHFLADFGLQTHDQATNKSSSNKWLFYHVGVYSLIWLIAMYGYTDMFLFSLCFAVITFIFHYITDYITSRLSKQFFSVEDYHNGFVVIGFDQLLHTNQLIYTYLYLMDIQYINELF